MFTSTKVLDRYNSMIILNERGLYYRQFPTANHPGTNLIRLGSVQICDGLPFVTFESVDSYQQALRQIELHKTQLKVAKEINSDSAQIDKISTDLIGWQSVASDEFQNINLPTQVFSEAEKLVSKAHDRYSLKQTDNGLVFTSQQTRDYELQKIAAKYAESYNASLERNGVTEGFITQSDALVIVRKRYQATKDQQSKTATKQSKAKSKVAKV